jgi:hypothetical protein
MDSRRPKGLAAKPQEIGVGFQVKRFFFVCTLPSTTSRLGMQTTGARGEAVLVVREVAQQSGGEESTGSRKGFRV